MVEKIELQKIREADLAKKNHGIPYSDTDLNMDLMAKITAANHLQCISQTSRQRLTVMNVFVWL